jgi:hypothetical protein
MTWLVFIYEEFMVIEQLCVDRVFSFGSSNNRNSDYYTIYSKVSNSFLVLFFFRDEKQTVNAQATTTLAGRMVISYKWRRYFISCNGKLESKMGIIDHCYDELTAYNSLNLRWASLSRQEK